MALLFDAIKILSESALTKKIVTWTLYVLPLLSQAGPWSHSHIQ